MDINTVVYVEGSYEYIEDYINRELKVISINGKLSETVLSKVNRELVFIREHKLALPYVFAQKLICYSEQNGYCVRSSKLIIDTPLTAYFMGIIEPNSIFYDYSFRSGKLIELTFSKAIKESILSFASALLGKDDYEDTGVKIHFI